MNSKSKRWAHWVFQPCGHWDWRINEMLTVGEVREGGLVLPFYVKTYDSNARMQARIEEYPSFESLRHQLATQCVSAVAAPRGFEVSTRETPEWRGGRALYKAFTWRGEAHIYDVSMNIVEGEWLQVMTPGAVRYGTLSPIRYRAMKRCKQTSMNSQGLLVGDAIANNVGAPLDESAIRRLRHNGIEPKGSY